MVPEGRIAMAYEGEHLGCLSDGTEVRRLTDEEMGRWERRYCIVGHSHWNPASFFAWHAAELEREAALHREAAALIHGRPPAAADLCDRDGDGYAVSPDGTRIDVLRSQVAGWHFSKESLSGGEREILAVAEQLLAELDRLGGGFYR